MWWKIGIAIYLVLVVFFWSLCAISKTCQRGWKSKMPVKHSKFKWIIHTIIFGVMFAIICIVITYMR